MIMVLLYYIYALSMLIIQAYITCIVNDLSNIKSCMKYPSHGSFQVDDLFTVGLWTFIIHQKLWYFTF